MTTVPPDKQFPPACTPPLSSDEDVPRPGVPRSFLPVPGEHALFFHGGGGPTAAFLRCEVPVVLHERAAYGGRLVCHDLPFDMLFRFHIFTPCPCGIGMGRTATTAFYRCDAGYMNVTFSGSTITFEYPGSPVPTGHGHTSSGCRSGAHMLDGRSAPIMFI